MPRKRNPSKRKQPSRPVMQEELPLLDLRAADLPSAPPPDTSRPADASPRSTRTIEFLLRALPLGLEHQIYDSSTEIHPHLLIEDSGEVVDLPADCIRWDALPPMAPGLEVAAIDMVVRVRRTAAA